MYKIKTLTVGQLKSNCYLAINNSYCLIIDPGDEADFISDKIQYYNLTPTAIIATHGHFDHIIAVFELQANYKIPFYLRKKDDFMINNLRKSAKYWMNSNDIFLPYINKGLGRNINLRGINFKILNTPGHTPGSISLYNKHESILFSGDLVFENGFLGRTDFSYSSKIDMDNSLRKIKKLPGNTTVFPGHGNSFKLSSI